MLRSTFCHLPGIGVCGEERLWRSGLEDWRRFLRLRPNFLAPSSYAEACSALEESEERLARHDARYFLERLPGLHKVRVLREFGASAAFLDIETTGLEETADVTVASVCQGGDLRAFVSGGNLDELASRIRGSPLVVTFHGEGFDLPILRRRVGMEMRKAHLDLYPLARMAGYRGTLKACAQRVGFQGQTSKRMDGAHAAALWQVFCRGHDPRALKLLIAYNADDVLSLRALAAKIYERSMELHPKHPKLRWPACPPVEYDAAWESLFFES